MVQSDLILILSDPIIGTLVAISASLIAGIIVAQILGEAKLKTDRDGIKRQGFSTMRILGVIITPAYIIAALSLPTYLLITLPPDLHNILLWTVNLTTILLIAGLAILLIPTFTNRKAGQLTIIVYSLATIIQTGFAVLARQQTSLPVEGVSTLILAPGFFIGFYLWARTVESPDKLAPTRRLAPSYPPMLDEATKPEVPPKGIPEKEEVDYCKFCGSELPEEAEICPSCGAKTK